MAISRLYLQIATDDGEVVRFRAGDKAEIDFIESCVTVIAAKGVGLFKTQAHVETSIRNGITEAIAAFKQRSLKG